jgi:isopentenyl diphosphate isomerase/L-lactate dehydrogenase-like FMN-dependent dehydrogenase
MPKTPLYETDVRFATISELIDAARHRLPVHVLEYLESGAGEERTVRANREAFDRWAFVPRTLTGAEPPQTETSFIGMELSLPLLSAPVGGDRLFHPEGHIATAAANAAWGAGMIAPEAGSFSFEQIAEVAPGLPRLLQLHPIEPIERFRRLAENALQAGYDGLCVTVDCPVGGWRERNKRNRFAPEIEVFAGNFDGDGEVAVAELFASLISSDQSTWTWDYLGDLCAEIGATWIAKGVLHPEDAAKAVEAGAAAILVSNHGGRQLDGAIASLDALPAVAAAVEGRAQVALDSGVRSGTHIAKAVALGADVVVLGRLIAYALAADGQAGVERMYELLDAELRTIMLLTGCSRLTELRGTLQRVP